jgi:3-oxoacyl-[acyl-carrier-protein] synthase-3
MAVEAVKLLLAKKKLSPDDIDIILVATTTPDMLFPSTACVLADKIGATQLLGL